MKHISLFFKLLMLLLGVAFSLFVLLNTMGVRMMQEKMLEKAKGELYQTANTYVSE